MADETQMAQVLNAIDDVQAKSDRFVGNIRNCLSQGRSLMASGTTIINAWKELQIARAEQEIRYNQFMELSRRNLQKFKEYLPYAEKNLQSRIDGIAMIREQLMMRNLSSMEEGELQAQNTLLKMLEMEHRAYFAELDRLLAL